MAVVMPNEILARDNRAAAWAPVQAAYEASVSEILSYEADPRVVEWLEEATRQLLARAGTMQKTALAQALIQKMRKGATVVIRKQETLPMSGTIFETIELRKRQLQASEPDLADHELLSRCFKADPSLYTKYRREVDRGDYLPEVKKHAIASVSTATGALEMLIEAEVKKGMSRPAATEVIIRQHPDLYKDHTAAMTGRG